jgi:hypothetical protein
MSKNVKKRKYELDARNSVRNENKNLEDVWLIIKFLVFQILSLTSGRLNNRQASTSIRNTQQQTR